jgi:DNA-binding transcriptional regulator/RsmH inhibitor MraZ
LRADGGIGRDIVIVGVGNRMEIWSRESWERYDAELSDERIRQLAMESGL